jgi:hypothetical protein
MITPRDAIVVYPVLAGLFAVTQQRPAWLFRKTIMDGHVEALRGTRVWPDNTVDQIGIMSESHAAARRTNPLMQPVWATTGTLADVTALVLDQLLPPSHPLAPGTPLAQAIAVVNGFGRGLTA